MDKKVYYELPVARFALLFVFFTSSLISAVCQVYEGKELVRASLIPGQSAIVPGQAYPVGILLEIAEGWHTYWRNPGDAGLSTQIVWSLPANFSVSEIRWPLPKRLIEPGNLIVYGYKSRVFFPFEIQVPAQLTDTEVKFSVKVEWLVCEAICIPGSASMEITLPVSLETQRLNAEVFDEVRKKLPQRDLANIETSWHEQGKGWILELRKLPPWAEEVDFYPFEQASIPDGEHPSPAKVQNQSASIFIPADGQISGVLVWQTSNGVQRDGVEVQSPQKFIGDTQETTQAHAVLERVESQPLTLWPALILGFLGGMVLNLMPCVLPVISLKVFSFLRQAGEKPQKVFQHGLVFSAGIFAWFWGLAVLIISIRAAGKDVSWAFQFQNPWFIYAISILVFVVALNLFGVFELTLPGKTTEQISSAAQKEGFIGSFLHGVFATLLATPCTAPFLGVALGFAFSQSAGVIFWMFNSIALGMALPYLLLAMKPGWMRFLPKPGEWMDVLKQMLGFPMLATLIWLLAVLGNQTDNSGIIWTLVSLFCLGFTLWIYGKLSVSKPSYQIRFLGFVSAVLGLVGAGWVSFVQFPQIIKKDFNIQKEVSSLDWSRIPWVPYSEKALEDFLEEGRSVFVDFTADWCITCKFNEKTAIETPEVRKFFQENGIVPMKADWTLPNPEIQAALAKFGRVGVPFYVFYPRGKKEQAVTFPEILTEDLLLQRIRDALK